MLAVVSLLPDWTWIATCVIAFITLLLVKHVLQVRSLPPGPFPLPIIGNLLHLRGKGNEFFNVLSRLHMKYKDIFTIWLGPNPTIIICNWELVREANIVKRNDFSGRIRRHSIEGFLDGDDDVGFTDFGPSWETLRKIMVSAVRKYVGSEKLADLSCDVVDRTAESLFKEGKPVDSINMMYLIVYNILASSSFGQRFELDDPDFLRLKHNQDQITEKFGVGVPSDVLPILKPFYKERLREIIHLGHVFKTYIREKYKEHVLTYQSGEIRDFTDAVLAAREEAEAEGKECLQYLTEGNLINIMENVFGAGTDTTRVFLTSLFLIICDKPEIQKKMQKEIDEHIGSRIPVQSDRSSCHYTCAVLTETLRYKPVIDITLEHKTICDTELGGYKIPKDTSCIFYIKGAHVDSTYWEDADKFKPERFLEPDGKYTNSRITAFMPFGIGRRACPGEKLALTDAFLVTTRLLQKYSFALETGPGSAQYYNDPFAFTNLPLPYNLIVKSRDFE